MADHLSDMSTQKGYEELFLTDKEQMSVHSE